MTSSADAFIAGLALGGRQAASSEFQVEPAWGKRLRCLPQTQHAQAGSTRQQGSAPRCGGARGGVEPIERAYSCVG